METAVQEMKDEMATAATEPLPVKQIAGLALLIILGLAGRFAPDAMLSLAVRLLSP